MKWSIVVVEGFGTVRVPSSWSYESFNGQLNFYDKNGDLATMQLKFNQDVGACFAIDGEYLPAEDFYNAEGVLAKKLDVTTNKAVNYEYDSLGRLIHSYQTDGSAVALRTEHVYDTENRIKKQSWQSGDISCIESYSYDEDDGSLTSMYVSREQNTYTPINDASGTHSKSSSRSPSYSSGTRGCRTGYTPARY